jgi:mitochondrial import inner membrane translocase subunit TIM54
MSSSPTPAAGVPETPKFQAPQAPSKQNPAFRMIGMPNFRFKLPSRNWLIFLSITGSFAAAVTYDRRQKKAAQKKWCDLVSHIAQDPLPVSQMPRKLTIFLSAPPGDGIRSSREYFKEYIKPILVAAAMDYDVIEGRKEGDVRYGTAEQIRRLRRRRGERGETANQEEMDPEQIVQNAREQLKIHPERGIKGDLVIGRHTWKEYLRGLHEGWLGPLDEPKRPSKESVPSLDDTPPSTSTDLPSENAMEEQKPAEEEKKPPSPPYAYISTSEYRSSPASPNMPVHLEPSAPIPHRHILGFFNTPIRIYHFLTQRHLADSIGRETAAIVLGLNRPYNQDSSFASQSSGDLDASPLATLALLPETAQTSQDWEQQSLLQSEEGDWHKSAKKPRKDDLERVWLDPVVMDSRIAERMRKFELAPDEEERATRIGQGIEKSRAVEVLDLRSEPVNVEGAEARPKDLWSRVWALGRS